MSCREVDANDPELVGHPGRCTIVITVEIEGDADKALAAVNDVLEHGVFQADVEEYQGEGGPLSVVTATAQLVGR